MVVNLIEGLAEDDITRPAFDEVAREAVLDPAYIIEALHMLIAQQTLNTIKIVLKLRDVACAQNRDELGTLLLTNPIDAHLRFGHACLSCNCRNRINN